MKKILTGIFCHTLSLALLAQGEEKWALGGSVGVVPKHGTEYFVPTVNVNIARRTNLFQQRLSIGAGAEFHFFRTYENHYSGGILFAYSLYKGWSFSATPGIIASKGMIKPMLQLETSWLFKTRFFDIGPIAEMSFARQDTHNMIGVSFAKNF